MTMVSSSGSPALASASPRVKVEGVSSAGSGACFASTVEEPTGVEAVMYPSSPTGSAWGASIAGERPRDSRQDCADSRRSDAPSSSGRRGHYRRAMDLFDIARPEHLDNDGWEAVESARNRLRLAWQ